MSKYIDAEKLIAEIRKRLKSLHGWETKNKTYYRNLGKESAYGVVLSIIASLLQEQPEACEPEYGPYARQYPKSEVSQEQPE